jgi:hypothetical protein
MTLPERKNEDHNGLNSVEKVDQSEFPDTYQGWRLA